MRKGRSRRGARRVIAIALLLWSLAGLGGAYGYVHHYAIYRGFQVPSTPAGVARGTVREIHFRSAAVGAPSRYLVYLPPGYAAAAAAGRRLPVLYLLHGYPGKMPVWVNVAGAQVAANELIAAHRIPPMILVMPAGKEGVLGADTEWADTASGRWMSYLRDVVANVDQRFATQPDRQHRGIAGVSEGGYGATNVALHNLDLFSVLESGGGYFTQTPAGVFAHASPAELHANSPAAYVGSLAPKLHQLPLRGWLFQGSGDPTPPQPLRVFAARLRSAGGDVRVDLLPGGHDWALFRAQTPRMLIQAGHWFGQHP